jgi:raffinose/stachyose/melibiose transport system permease protein
MKKRTSPLKITSIVVGALLAILCLAPIFLLLINSFKTQKGIYIDVMALPQSSTLTLNSYPDAVDRMGYLNAFINSLFITVASTAVIVIFTSMAAWVLVRFKKKIAKVIFFIFAASMLIPFQCVMLPLVRIMGQIGLLNPGGLIFMYLGFGASLSILLYHGFIKGIPVELEEAAMIDGCNMFQRYRYVVFPLLRSITITVAIINIMWIWNDFLLPQLVINRPEWQTLPLRTFLFFGQFSKRWDLATAALILGMVPIIIFYLFGQKYIVRGVTEGALKG